MKFTMNGLNHHHVGTTVRFHNFFFFLDGLTDLTPFDKGINEPFLVKKKKIGIMSD